MLFLWTKNFFPFFVWATKKVLFEIFFSLLRQTPIFYHYEKNVRNLVCQNEIISQPPIMMMEIFFVTNTSS